MATELSRSYQRNIVIETKTDSSDDAANEIRIPVEKNPSGRRFVITNVLIRDDQGYAITNGFRINYDLTTAEVFIEDGGSGATIDDCDVIIVSGYLRPS